MNPSDTEMCINCGEALPMGDTQPDPVVEPPQEDPLVDNIVEDLDAVEPTPPAPPRPPVTPPVQEVPPTPTPPRPPVPPTPPVVTQKPEPPQEKPKPTVLPPRRTVSVSDYRARPPKQPRDLSRSTIPLSRMGAVGEEEEKLPEGFKLVSDSDGTELEFKGIEEMLNRDKLDVGNMSISGREHAKIYYKDGNWQLEDISSNKATFVQIDQPVPLKDGMIVIFGQKIFRFQSLEKEE